MGKAGDLSVKRFFDVTKFSNLTNTATCPFPAIGNGTDFGNSGVGIVRGPGQTNTDFSITKTTPIGEKQSIQFRSEFFNLFNHPQFAIPATAGAAGFNQLLFPSSPNFGLITATSINPRLIQFALRYQF